MSEKGTELEDNGNGHMVRCLNINNKGGENMDNVIISVNLKYFTVDKAHLRVWNCRAVDDISFDI